MRGPRRAVHGRVRGKVREVADGPADAGDRGLRLHKMCYISSSMSMVSISSIISMGSIEPILFLTKKNMTKQDLEITEIK